jgi:hypothetical protein
VNIGTARRESRSVFEEGDRRVVIVNAQSIEGFCERFVGGVLRFLSQRSGSNQAERGKSNRRLPLALVGKTDGNSQSIRRKDDGSLAQAVIWDVR